MRSKIMHEKYQVENLNKMSKIIIVTYVNFFLRDILFKCTMKVSWKNNFLLIKNPENHYHSVDTI